MPDGFNLRPKLWFVFEDFIKCLSEYDPKKYLITNKDKFQYLANKYKWKKKK